MDSHAHAETADLLQHAAFLRRIARGLLADDQRAEDVVQDVYATALERPPAHRTFLRGWLGTLARNRALNVGREERARRAREASASRTEAADSHAAATESLEVERLVCEQVLALDAEKRTVVHLRYYEGLTPTQIARRLGVPVKTVKSRLHRALGELRERLDRTSRGRSWALALLPLARGRVGTATLIAAGTGVVAVALIVAWSLRAPVAHPTLVADAAEGEPALAASAEPTAPSAKTAPTTAENRVAVETRAEPCALVVDLRWQADGVPAGALGVSAWTPDDPAPRVDVLRTTSDEHGRARFEDLPPGKFHLRLDRGLEREVTLAAGETETIEWLVPEGTDVEGVVRSAEGEPVAGAEVWCERLVMDELLGWPVATTDARGEFRVRGIGPVVRLVARARGHAPSRQVNVSELPLGPSGVRRAEIALGARAVSITGTVTDPEGRPVVGARVRGGSNVSACGAITDAHGDFALAGDLAGYATDLLVVAHGFPVSTTSIEFEESEIYVEIVLECPATVRGRVLSASGDAIAGATVQGGTDLSEPYPDRAMPRPRTTTDAEGRFVLGWMTAGANEVLANTADSRDGRALVNVTCVAGEESMCELRLDAGRVITGRVVDGQGHGVAGWTVLDSPPRMAQSAPSVTTGADGSFALFGVAEGLHTLEVTVPGELPVPPRARVRARPGDDVEIVVASTAPPRSVVRGELRRRDGGVPAELALRLQPKDFQGALRMVVDPHSGRFEQGGLLPGEYSLRVVEGNVLVAELPSVTLAQDAPRDIGILWVEPPGAVEIELVGEPPDPTGYLGLHLWRPNSSPVHLELDGNRLRADQVPPGTWEVRGSAAERFLYPVQLEVRSGDATRAQCRLAPRHDLVLTFRFEPVDPMERDLRLEIVDELGQVLLDERYDIDSAPFGTQLHAVRMAAWKALDPLDASTRTLTLQLPPGALTVRATTDHGRTASAVALVDPAGGNAADIVVR